VNVEADGRTGDDSEVSEQDAAKYRAHAEECRQQAERSFNTLDKEAWLRTWAYSGRAEAVNGGPFKSIACYNGWHEEI
jgi:hypothetical protein